MSNEKEVIEQVEPSTEEPQIITLPVEMYVDMKVKIDRYQCGRPLRMPASLTVQEYNFLVGYMKAQRKELVNSDPKIPALIDETKSTKESKAN